MLLQYWLKSLWRRSCRSGSARRSRRRLHERPWIRASEAIVAIQVLEDRTLLDGLSVEIHGTKWNDLDGDGTRDLGEPGLAGWTIYADLNNNGALNTGEPSTVTLADDPSTVNVDETGMYALTGLQAGTYTIAEVRQVGWPQTYPNPATPWRILANPTPAASDWFGYQVDVSQDGNVLIGALDDDTGANNAGAAYVFDGSSGTLLRTFLNPTPEASDEFGVDVAWVGNKVLVGAYGDNTGGDNAGVAYLFDSSTGALLLTIP